MASRSDFSSGLYDVKYLLATIHYKYPLFIRLFNCWFHHTGPHTALVVTPENGKSHDNN